MKWGSVALAVIAVASVLAMISAPRFSPLAIAAWGGIGFVVGFLNPRDLRQAGFLLLGVFVLSVWNVYGPPPQPGGAKWESIAMWAGAGMGWVLGRTRSSDELTAANDLRA